MSVTPYALLAAGLVAGWLANDLRASRRKRRLRSPFPIPTVPLTEIDPVFAENHLGPTLATEVAFVGRGPIKVPGGTSDAEAWILAVLAKRARSIFELGTCTGKTAYLLARNAPADASVVTLTLAPDQRDRYTNEATDDRRSVKYALRESRFESFLYTGTAVESKITQLFGDSKEFDETPYARCFDLVFVDGSHAYSYVVSDSAKALAMVKPGGLVLWHDYEGPAQEGVFRAINELAQRLPIVHLQGTTFAAYRADG